MKSAVEPLNPTRVKLTVEVPFEELKPSLDAAYKKIGQQINVPGFRRGKVPAVVIDQRVGRSYVLDEAVNDALPKLYVQALQDNNLTPMSQPDLDLSDFEDGAHLNFTAELDVRPEIPLPDYLGVEVQVDDVAVSDDDVDEQLKALRERFGSLTPVDRPANENDFVTIDLSATKDGQPIEEAQATGMSYQFGSGTMLEGLDEALDGMSAGEERTFSSTLVGGEYKDQSVDVTVKVTAVKEQELPEFDDEFAQTASEFDTVEELREDVRDRLIRGARIEQAGAARDAVLEELLTRVEIPLPESAYADELKARRDSIDEQLSYAGLTEDDYLASEGQSEEEFTENLSQRVREAMAAQFLLDEIASVEAVGIDESELTQHLLRKAQQAGATPEQFVQHVMEHNQVPELAAEVRRAKALAHVVENAVVTDASGNAVELKRLQPDGTYADEDSDDAAQSTANDSDPEADTSSMPDESGERAAADAAAGVFASTDYLVESDDSTDK